MKELFALDACGLIAFLGDEPGAKAIEILLRRAFIKDCEIYMHIINLLELSFILLYKLLYWLCHLANLQCATPSTAAAIR
ncbi:MAG: hypothetical protein ABRQ39_06505 [Candidatus Eremiobacterota bacterium]